MTDELLAQAVDKVKETAEKVRQTFTEPKHDWPQCLWMGEPDGPFRFANIYDTNGFSFLDTLVPSLRRFDKAKVGGAVLNLYASMLPFDQERANHLAQHPEDITVVERTVMESLKNEELMILAVSATEVTVMHSIIKRGHEGPPHLGEWSEYALDYTTVLDGQLHERIKAIQEVFNGR